MLQRASRGKGVCSAVVEVTENPLRYFGCSIRGVASTPCLVSALQAFEKVSFYVKGCLLVYPLYCDVFLPLGAPVLSVLQCMELGLGQNEGQEPCAGFQQPSWGGFRAHKKLLTKF